MKARVRLLSFFFFFFVGGAYLAHAVDIEPKFSAPRTQARSGYQFLTPDLRALQDDDFANPGLLWVARGETLWANQPSPARKACAGCHDAASRSMKGVAARYPRYDTAVRRVIGLEERINRCRTVHQHQAPWAFESAELLSMTAFVSRQSHGIALQVDAAGPAAAASYARGRRFFYERRGQLDLACNECHEDHVGAKLRGDTISQGQVNGFPIYRQLWQSLASSHRMFAWCNEAVRAQPYPAGAQEYVDLELFLKVRGAGLAIEAPAIRK